VSTRLSRLERITNLVLALLDASRPLSLREIGLAVAGYPTAPGALRQAFERDKRTLRDNGIPISVERVNDDDQIGYRILPEQYYLPDLGLTPDEEAALAFALLAVRLEGGVGREVLHKLGTARAADVAPVAVLPSLPFLGLLQQAIRDRAPVAFAYHGRQRRVDGYGLVFRGGSWYFVGRDAGVGESGGLRRFRVDRFESEPVAGTPVSYERPDGFDAATELRYVPFQPEASGPVEPEATEVEVAVDAREAAGVIALVGAGAVRGRDADGSVRLAFPVGDEEAFYSWVLGLGDAVEVLAPVALRRGVIDRLETAARAGGPR
jgi:predicted DNA-binding transcriptional regulator YafY